MHDGEESRPRRPVHLLVLPSGTFSLSPVGWHPWPKGTEDPFVGGGVCSWNGQLTGSVEARQAPCDLNSSCVVLYRVRHVVEALPRAKAGFAQG